MPTRSKTSGVLLVIVLAGLGFLLVYLPSQVTEQYRRASELGATWGYVYLGVVLTGALLLSGSTAWVLWRLWRVTRRKQRRQEMRAKNPSQLTAQQRQEEIRENLQSVAELQEGTDVSPELRSQLRPMVERIETKQGAKRLEIVAFGTVSSGKSSLLNALAGRDVFATDVRGGTTLVRNEIPWPGADEVVLVDTPGLSEVEGEGRSAVAAQAAQDADLVLLVVDGPLRETEVALLRQLAQMEKRVLVCLNKEDLYDQRQRQLLVGQIIEQTANLVRPEDVVCVQSRSWWRHRTRVLADQSEQVEEVEIAPDIEPLARRMMSIVQRDGRDLLLANLLLQSRGLVDQARQQVQEALDRRAWETVDRHMWAAGGAAALSPLPVVDLAAGVAVSTKMVVDLARVYHQDVDVGVATSLLSQQGKNLLAVAGTSVATPAVAATVASMLKTVPGVGTVAGGVLQGVVQALITRWIGAVFIAYFRNEMREPRGGMAALARREWERMTSRAELRKLVQAARNRLSEENDP
jgi:small GTP-binding protein